MVAFLSAKDIPGTNTFVNVDDGLGYTAGEIVSVITFFKLSVCALELFVFP